MVTFSLSTLLFNHWTFKTIPKKKTLKNTNRKSIRNANSSRVFRTHNVAILTLIVQAALNRQAKKNHLFILETYFVDSSLSVITVLCVEILHNWRKHCVAPQPTSPVCSPRQRSTSGHPARLDTSTQQFPVLVCCLGSAIHSTPHRSPGTCDQGTPSAQRRLKDEDQVFINVSVERPVKRHTCNF